MQATGSRLVSSSLTTGNKKKDICILEDLDVTNSLLCISQKLRISKGAGALPGPLNLQKEN